LIVFAVSRHSTQSAATQRLRVEARIAAIKARLATAETTWADNPIWDVEVPPPPDWHTLSDHEQGVFKAAAILFALRQVATDRKQSLPALMDDWELM